MTSRRGFLQQIAALVGAAAASRLPKPPPVDAAPEPSPEPIPAPCTPAPKRIDIPRASCAYLYRRNQWGRMERIADVTSISMNRSVEFGPTLDDPDDMGGYRRWLVDRRQQRITLALIAHRGHIMDLDNDFTNCNPVDYEIRMIREGGRVQFTACVIDHGISMPPDDVFTIDATFRVIRQPEWSMS